MDPISSAAPVILIGAVIDLLYPGRPDAIRAAQFVLLVAIGQAIVFWFRNGRGV